MEIIKNYVCENCYFKSNFSSEWLKHIGSQKHKRNGLPKTKICDKCEYSGLTHWNLKMHIISQHSTIEERSKQKYYCNDCDLVFFCSIYKEKHINGIVHKNKVQAKKINIII